MVFSSVPAYLDPSNWQPQQIINHHQIIGSTTTTNTTTTNPLLTPPPPPHPHGGSGSGPSPGSIRPGSMSERARLANVPMPESALKCPRCESTNTKFCYFNNYSLSQPRHFCKTCRRYWTRGGALRSVPVGGGCRRNKRSSSKSSSGGAKSPAASGDSSRQINSTSNSTNHNSNNNNNNHNNNSVSANLLNLTPTQFTPLRFMSPLGQLSENYGGDLGLNYNLTGVNSGSEMNFHGSASNLLGINIHQQQQFPYLGSLDPITSAGYQFHGGELGFLGGGGGEMRPKISSSLLSQLASVKMEDSRQSQQNAHHDLSLNSRQLLGGLMQGNNDDHQWNINANGVNWTDQISSFSSSSTSNHLQ